MPQLIRTPEDVLRETKQDLYFIKFHEWSMFKDKPKITARREIYQWFKEHLAHIELEEIGFSEFSGIVSSSTGCNVRVAFDASSLEHFVSVWENPDGSYKDARWTCYLYPYSLYLQKELQHTHQNDDETERP